MLLTLDQLFVGLWRSDFPLSQDNNPPSTRLTTPHFKWNSHQNATEAFFVDVYESNLHVKHNDDERGTFKIYRIFVFGSSSFSQCKEHFYISIKITILKTVRRLDTTWIFACNTTRVSTQEHKHWSHCLCTQSLLKRQFFDNHVSRCFLRMPPSCQWEVSISKCDVTWTWVKVDCL